MVDNRGISPIPSFNFKQGDASGMANKMSEEKMGQGGEYFAQEMQEEENTEEQRTYQDRSAQLRASLESLAMANAGSMLVKTLKEKERLKEESEKKSKKGEKNQKDKQEKEDEEIIWEIAD